MDYRVIGMMKVLLFISDSRVSLFLRLIAIYRKTPILQHSAWFTPPNVADRKKCSLAQPAIVWVFHRGTDIIPLIGARKLERLNEALGALQVELTLQDYEEIDGEVPAGSIAGDRYAPGHMAMLDSDR
jgi:diketogulonate reductase-like aldo/keto reductase